MNDRSATSGERRHQVRTEHDDPRDLSPDSVRERIVRLAFGGDWSRFEQFVQALREALPPTVTVVLRGSAITGQRWADGQPFDGDGPGTSDLDLTLVGGNMLKLWKPEGFYIPRLHTAPLSDKAPDICPVLVPLRRALCALAGRPVNIQATSNFLLFARDVIFDQPYFTIIETTEDEKASEDEDDDEAERREDG